MFFFSFFFFFKYPYKLAVSIKNILKAIWKMLENAFFLFLFSFFFLFFFTFFFLLEMQLFQANFSHFCAWFVSYALKETFYLVRSHANFLQPRACSWTVWTVYNKIIIGPLELVWIVHMYNVGVIVMNNCYQNIVLKCKWTVHVNYFMRHCCSF